jgi:hypothetical protein
VFSAGFGTPAPRGSSESNDCAAVLDDGPNASTHNASLAIVPKLLSLASSAIQYGGMG